MKIELKNFKCSKFASQETLCFEASVYIDGKPEGTVSNSGTGGSNLFHPYETGVRIQRYAETLPPIPPEDLPFEADTPMAMHADMLISKLCEDIMASKDLKHLIGSSVVWVAADGRVYQTRGINKTVMGQLATAGVDAMRKVAGIQNESKAILLNTLPFDEALALFKKHST